MPVVYFSHGKESGPRATKIVELEKVARQAGLDTLSVDYRGLASPQARVEKLTQIVDSGSNNHPHILVGSSMGAYVSLLACNQIQIQASGLFLLAPAVYLPGYEQVTAPLKGIKTQIIHGWQDEVVPVENALKFAQKYSLNIQLLPDSHRLSESIPTINRMFADFLVNTSKLPRENNQ